MISDITELKRQKHNWTRQTENSNQEKSCKIYMQKERLLDWGSECKFTNKL
jgi:hypothetical protein